MGDASQTEDAALLDAWRGGDRDAGEQLLVRHFSTVFRYFRARLPASAVEDAEDLTQRTFEACVAGRERVHSDIRAYIFGVARRQLLREWKRRRVRGEAITPSQAELEAQQPGPSSAMRAADSWQVLSDAMSRMPVEFASVLERFYLESQTIEQIANELEIAKGTVKSRLFRGKAMLRKAIEAVESRPKIRETSFAHLDSRESDSG